MTNIRALAVLLSLTVWLPAQAMSIRTDVFEENGGTIDNPEVGFKEHIELAKQFPGRAMLLDPKEDVALCSATYLSKSGPYAFFITAAHCFEEQREGGYERIETASGHKYRIINYDYSDFWKKSQMRGDLVVVTVDGFEEDIPSAMFYCGRNEVGKVGTLLSSGNVGLGTETGEDRDDDKTYYFGATYQAGRNMIDAISEKDPDLGDATDLSGMIQVDFDDGTDEHNTLSDRGSDPQPVDRFEFSGRDGDSGGSLWVDTPEGPAIAGILSVGKQDPRYGAITDFARISDHLEMLGKYGVYMSPGADDVDGCYEAPEAAAEELDMTGTDYDSIAREDEAREKNGDTPSEDLETSEGE